MSELLVCLVMILESDEHVSLLLLRPGVSHLSMLQLPSPDHAGYYLQEIRAGQDKQSWETQIKTEKPEKQEVQA